MAVQFSITTVTETGFCSQNFQYVLSFHSTKIPEQANTVERGNWVAARFSIRSVTETGFCSQSFQCILSFHLTEIPQRNNLYKEETGWLYSSIVEWSLNQNLQPLCSVCTQFAGCTGADNFIAYEDSSYILLQYGYRDASVIEMEV